MIGVRPETRGDTLVVEASGKLTAEDYEGVFIPELERMLQEFKRLRVVFYLNDSFEGWELGAMWDDARFGMRHYGDFDRIAMVGGPRWVGWMSRLGSRLMSIEFKVFDREALGDAIAWATR